MMKQLKVCLEHTDKGCRKANDDDEEEDPNYNPNMSHFGAANDTGNMPASTFQKTGYDKLKS